MKDIKYSIYSQMLTHNTIDLRHTFVPLCLSLRGHRRSILTFCKATAACATFPVKQQF